MEATFTLNGRRTSVEADPEMPLLWAIRERIGLTGSKFGCGLGVCGACTVHVDGEPVRSCITTVSDVEGRSITTIEGVSGREADAVKRAWLGLNVVQCGYCQSGQIMSAIALLMQTPNPTNNDISNAMSQNICRCGTYLRIRAAIHEAARTMER